MGYIGAQYAISGFYSDNYQLKGLVLKEVFYLNLERHVSPDKIIFSTVPRSADVIVQFSPPPGIYDIPHSGTEPVAVGKTLFCFTVKVNEIFEEERDIYGFNVESIAVKDKSPTDSRSYSCFGFLCTVFGIPKESLIKPCVEVGLVKVDSSDKSVEDKFLS